MFNLRDSSFSFQSAVLFCIPISYNVSLSCSTSSPIFGIIILFSFKHFSECAVTNHFGLNLHIPGEYWCWACFHLLLCHSYFFFSEVCVQMLSSNFSLDCLNHCVVKVLYMLWIQVLYQVYVLKIFSLNDMHFYFS